jgi:hypothetical protein
LSFALHISARLMNFLIRQTVCFMEAGLKWSL